MPTMQLKGKNKTKKTEITPQNIETNRRVLVDEIMLNHACIR